MRALAAMGLTAVSVAACGDAIPCPSAGLIVIESPGDTIDVDLDVVTPGVQTDVRIRSTLDAGVAVTLTARSAAGVELASAMAITDAEGDATFGAVTLPSGLARLDVSAEVACGEVHDARDVNVFSVGEIVVAFAGPAADGNVGRNDGVVSGSELALELCGTTSVADANVTVAVDGGAPVAADVDDAAWCAPITVAETPPFHTIVVLASAPQAMGIGTLTLAVDLSGPEGIVDLAASVVDRQTLHLAWTAPAEAGASAEAYVVKLSPSPITDANFDAIGSAVTAPTPGAPGTAEQLDVAARTGTAFWIAVAATDAAGNRAPAAVAGPLTPLFAQSGAVTPGDASAGNLQVGWAIASGRFNDDELVDVAIGAPGETVAGDANTGTVSVYFGSPAGLPSAPDLVIRGTAPGGKLGSGLAAVRWSAADRDDLAIGAPRVGGSDGAVYVFDGGAAMPAGLASADDATVTIDVAATPGWFAGANLGTVLDRARWDDDAVDDLVISAPNGGGARGGVVVVYGGTVTASHVGLSDVDPGPAAGTVASLVEDPAATTGQLFGLYAHVVGATQGSADPTDDLVVGYVDDGIAGDAVYVFRSDGTRPPTPGVTQSGFLSGRDVRLEYDSASATTAFGAQATTIEDQNGDGARDLVVSAHRADGVGAVLIVDGDTIGTGGVARTSDAGVVLTTINGGNGTTRLGAAIAEGGAAVDSDIDGDGHEDLLVAAQTGGVGRFYAWFGGQIPTGTATVATAGYAVTAPPSFLFAAPPGNRGPAGQARWTGDVDGDGLADVCWAAPNDNARDGGFELLR